MKIGTLKQKNGCQITKHGIEQGQQLQNQEW